MGNANDKASGDALTEYLDLSSSAYGEVSDRVKPIMSSRGGVSFRPTGNSSSSRGGVSFQPTLSDRAVPTDSARSGVSLSSYNSSGGGSSSAPSPSLRDNLMRTQTNRDPKYFYQTMKILGAGSMGSVAKVRKRNNVVGGSARQDYVQSIHGAEGICFSLPLIGNILRNCTGKDMGKHVKRGRDLFEDSPASTSVEDKKKKRALGKRSSSIISYSAGKPKDIYFAIKTIHMDRVTDPTFVEELRNEIEILKTLDHPNIVRPIETFQYRNNTAIVMELCEGGDLYTRDPYSEEEALRITTSVLSAIEYMHTKNVVHRDLKYENIMFCSKHPQSDVKVIDFGLSKKYLPEDRLHEGVGTFYSMAPEVIRGDYNEKADVWSLAVIAFMLLSSQMPFFGKTQEAVMQKIINCDFTMRGRKWKRVSNESRKFVIELLVVDPSERPSASEAMQMDWIKQIISPDSIHASDEDLIDKMDCAQASIEAFASYSRLKRLALMVIAHKATSEEIGFLRKIFDKYDRSHDGMITLVEFKEALEAYGYEEEELEHMFTSCDLDGTGIIHYTEFLAATIEAHGQINEEALAEAFDRMDSDDSGYISTGNLREILGECVPPEYVEEMVLEAESELNYSPAMRKQMSAKPAKDHFLSYDEFIALWDHQQEDRREEALKKIERRRHELSQTTTMTTMSSSPPLHSIPEISSIDMDDIDDNEKGEADTLSTSAPSDSSFDPELGTCQFMTEKAISVRRYEAILQSQ